MSIRIDLDSQDEIDRTICGRVRVIVDLADGPRQLSIGISEDAVTTTLLEGGRVSAAQFVPMTDIVAAMTIEQGPSGPALVRPVGVGTPGSESESCNARRLEGQICPDCDEPIVGGYCRCDYDACSECGELIDDCRCTGDDE
jgi:hypothetical protein